MYLENLAQKIDEKFTLLTITAEEVVLRVETNENTCACSILLTFPSIPTTEQEVRGCKVISLLLW